MTPLEAALGYTTCGLSVLPIRVGGKKDPDTEVCPGWKQYQSGIADEFDIRGWYRNNNAGVGIIGGMVSGGLEIIDVETREHARLWTGHVAEAGHPELLDRLHVVKSPRGYHFYYRCEKPGPNTHLARRAATENELLAKPTKKIYELIETRGEGGYVVAPGSPAECHPSGLTYELYRGDWQNIPVISMNEREILFESARSLNEYFAADKEYAEPTSSNPTGDRPGDLFNARATWAEVLEPHGWRSQRPSRWIRPGGNRDSAQVVVNGTRLWVFTSSTELPSEKALSKFAVYTLLTHKGDFAAATKALAQQGYCKPKDEQTNFEPPAWDEDDEIDEPIPLWPTLPQEALYGLAGKVAELATEKSEADPAAVLATFLVRAGATFGANAYFNVGDTKHHPRLFSIIVGASSRARKGTSLNPVERIFEIAESKACADNLFVSPGPLSSGEGLIYAVRDPEETNTDDEKEKKDADQGVQDKRLMVVESEFGGALRAMQRQGNNLSAVVRDAWDKGTIAPLTKNNRLKCTDAHITILGHITRNELGALLENVELFNGFANRFIWFCARRSKVIAFPEPMDAQRVEDVALELAEAIRYGQEKRVINWQPEAAKLWMQVYPKITEEHGGVVGECTSRAEAQIIRLAMVYALLDRDDMIRVAHLVAAMAVWKYCFASVRYVFAPATATEGGEPGINERILEVLGTGEKTQRELNNCLNRNYSADELKKALNTLQAVGRISQRTGDSSTKGGRKPVLWSLAIGVSSGRA